ncbi:MAG: hypothetical protein EXQ86_11475 [Rhodospirillales bacterium]|nr:hypothetical protein [Rhodospirillales bacterium]
MGANYRRAKLVAAVLLLCLASGPAKAQGAVESVKSALASIWDSVRSIFPGGDAVAAITPPSPVQIIHGLEGGSEFWQHLRDAGYELKEISSSVGLIPDVKVTFQLARELSDADRDSLEHKLEIDAIKQKGFIAALQRQIVRSLLEASNLKELRITKLDIVLLPLPAAEFVMEPKEAPFSEEHDAIFRAIQKSDVATRERMEARAKKLGAAPKKGDN